MKTADVGFWMGLIGAVLLAADLLGPHLTKLEALFDRLMALNFLTFYNSVRRLWPFRLFVVQEGESEFDQEGESEFDMEDDLESADRNYKPTKLDTVKYIIELPLLLIVVWVFTALVLLLLAVYIALLLIEVLYLIIILPYRVGVILRTVYHLPSALRVIGLIVFLTGTLLYYFGSE